MADRTRIIKNHKNKGTRHISEPVKNYLWKSSAGKCSYPNCRTDLVLSGTDYDDPATIGDIAHIFAHSVNGPRPNPDGFTEAINSYENLIMLCKNHHRQVDVQPNTFTVSDLRGWKRDHESWVSKRLAEEEFTNADIETIINWLTDSEVNTSTDYTLRPIRDKMLFNHLSPSTQNLITMGLMRVEEVTIYVTHRAKLEPLFPEKLLQPLSTEYVTMRTKGLNSDFIFEELRHFACGRSFEFRKQMAGLAIIVYFFERCEIFEK